MNYREIPLEISYKSVGEETFSQILNPLLSCTKIYKRSVGFFSSSALNFIGDGILELARNGGKICLATSPQLSDDDIFAIQSGYEARELIEKQFLSEVQSALKLISDENAKMLYMLIKEEIIEVKIVTRRNGIYHDKLALLEDFDGNTIACVGSNNETAFSGCELRGIITPNSVTSIGRGTFDNCSSLKTVFYKGTAEQWNRIEIIRTDICLIMATRYYYSESEPTNYGNFWHYDTDGVTPVIW